MIKFTGNLRLDFEKATAEITKLKDRIPGYQEQIVSLQTSVRNLRRSKECDKKQYVESLAEKDAIIKELQNRLAHAEALLNHDGSNTGTPTSQTPINKNKVIPNSRRNTGKTKGGQTGHTKASLEAPDESEITDTVGHPLQDDECCPRCRLTDCIPTGESEVKYEYDVRIKVVKIKHEFFYYECNNCGTVFRSQIPPSLKEKVQYGSGLQAFALSLTNTVNAAMNKASMFLAGITGGELTPCEGYIAKLQTRAAKGLRQFREDLKLVLITRKIVYWDDTVIFILAERACFRFYGDESIAYYTAHAHKDMESLDDDNVLNLLTSDTKTMHDHNTVNYNDKYSFENIECNQHLQRDCQKNTDDTCHQWSDDLKGHISTTIKDRNDSIARGEESFSEAYVNEFHRKVDEYLENGWKENEADPGNYGASFEQTLLNRIAKYRRNYFLWVEDFSLPTTNNLSERGLRGVKSHMKISGQFESEAAADNHALNRTYIETCRRNGINEIDALQRLCEGNPYTVAEIFSASPS
ncbi:MAG: transposase [Roseburia sp.]|nr:transposase [Roseburia sp.]